MSATALSPPNLLTLSCPPSISTLYSTCHPPEKHFLKIDTVLIYVFITYQPGRMVGILQS
jgi:hypothetical protein